MMTRLTTCAIALLIGVLASARAEAEGPKGCGGRDLTRAEGLAAAEPQPADDLVNAEGLLWRIEKPGVPPSYLFGTMHSTDDSAVEVARRAAGEIEGAKVVATELGGPMDPVEKANIGAATLARALDRDHDTFAGPVAPEDRERIEKFLAGRGYPNEFAHHLKLWFLALLTAFPACEVERAALNLPEVDELLAEYGKGRRGESHRTRNAPGAARRHREHAPRGRGDVAQPRRPRAGNERRRLCDHASPL